MKCLVCDKHTKEIIAKRLRSGENRNVYYCNTCELGMLDRKGVGKNLKVFYDTDYRKKHTPALQSSSNPSELFRMYADFQEDRIKHLKKYINKKTRLLEIGCSAGMFLFHIKKHVKEIVGMDYDSRAAGYAAKKCGCEVFTNDIDEAGFDEASFDVICLFQTVEHIENPVDFFIKIKKYLKPKGVIYIEVPNLHDSLIYAYKLDNHYKNFYFHAAHLWYFTSKSLRMLMRNVGFEGEIFFSQDYNILNHMHWISTDSPQPTNMFGLSAPQLPLRDNFDSKKKKEMNVFIQKMDKDYRALLSKLEITSNISFIGSSKK